MISKLTKDNYHDPEMNRKYMSVSLFKSLVPFYPKSCQAKTMAKLKGEWQEEPSKALLQGQYLHSWAEGELQEFTSKHPELFKNNGGLYADYKKVDEMINTIKKDEYMLKTIKGGKEKIFTANLFNIDWKIRIDVYNPEMKTFTDLKTTRNIHRKQYNPFAETYQTFIEYWGYDDVQIPVYAEIERLANNRDKGDYFVPHIAAVDKQDPPDKIVIHFPTTEENWIQNKLEQVEILLQDIIPVWKGEEEPERCSRCEYCRSTKRIKKSIHYFDFIGE